MLSLFSHSRQARHWWSLVTGRPERQFGDQRIVQRQVDALVFWFRPVSRHLSVRNEQGSNRHGHA